MGSPEFNSPTLGVMLGVEAVRDAVHFVNVQPASKIDVDLLIDAIIALYKSVGLQLPEAQLLYRESMERYSGRWNQIAKETVGG